jgi:hydroxyacylglutathione hydrolase
MTLQITPLHLPFPFKLTSVNAYLVNTGEGFFLVDTGMSNSRQLLETSLDHLCCHPGDLKLILLTHGDFDHTGNAAYLRGKFNTRIAMHQADAGMLENGDFFWNRKITNPLFKFLVPLLGRIGRQNQCTPDVLLQDGTSLADYGLEATVLNTPGHSTGSICILTADGDLFAGDLLISSRGKPRLNSMLSDRPTGEASLQRLKTLPIRMVYPGHGKPFAWKDLVES